MLFSFFFIVDVFVYFTSRFLFHRSGLVEVFKDSNYRAASEFFSSLIVRALDNNKLTEVPSWIGGLTLLQSLFLHSNNISRVPQQLQSFWANKSASLVVHGEQSITMRLLL